MVELQALMTEKSIIDSNIKFEENAEILFCCASTWVTEASLQITYGKLIYSHWVLYSKEQDIIKTEDDLESEGDISKSMCEGLLYSVEINEITQERTSNDGENSKNSFTCQLCHKGFSRKDLLKTHKVVHTGERPFKCQICRKGFSQRSNLNTHKLTHSGEKTFQCGECEKRFARKSTLEFHKLTHTGEKPFSCQICHKGFSQMSSLNTHKLTHSGEKRFECGDCKKRFA